MALKPLIAICGTTGVGKSRLAVELALSLSSSSQPIAKIINADAMQVYEGLDILTNKIPTSEQNGVEHLLMGFKKPGDQYVVRQWVPDAHRAIGGTHAEGKVPIVVGGTSYWMHHLLFPGSLASTPMSHIQPDSNLPSFAIPESLASLPPGLISLFEHLPATPPSAKSCPDEAFELHTLLSRLDLPMANRWHWKDTRKVLRSLQIIKETGRAASEIIVDAYNARGVGSYRTLILWLYTDPAALDKRLDERVDDMLSKGLLEEIRAVHSAMAPKGDKETDYTLGVYQAIGFKEFCTGTAVITEENQPGYSSAVDAMKLRTRKYARRQIKWIRNKLLPTVQASNTHDRLRHMPPQFQIFLLDISGVDTSWGANVLAKATELSRAFLGSLELPDPLCLSDAAREQLSASRRLLDPAEVLQKHRKVVCPVCTTQHDRPVLLTDGDEWEAHKLTRAHRRLASKVTSLHCRLISDLVPLDS